MAQLSDPVHGAMPAIVTTSLGGCANAKTMPGLVTPTPINALDNVGANSMATNCQYTAMMNGTSAATPNVAGVVAMMLEANPNLTVRDIKYILAKTAKKVDPTWAGVEIDERHQRCEHHARRWLGEERRRLRVQ